jgi:hypothetical protein
VFTSPRDDHTRERYLTGVHLQPQLAASEVADGQTALDLVIE